MRLEWKIKYPQSESEGSKLTPDQRQVVKDRAKVAEKFLGDKDFHDVVDFIFFEKSLKLANEKPYQDETFADYERRSLAMLNSLRGSVSIRDNLRDWYKQSERMNTHSNK